MAYIVATRPGRYEVRESRNTSAGPRSRTLASFRELDHEVVAKVQTRAEKPPSAAELQEAAVRVGAPVATPPVDRAVRQTLRLLSRGERLQPQLKRLLLDALSSNGGPASSGAKRPPVSDAARAAEQWIDSPPEERGRALRELLELADALPISPRSEEIGFPRLRSA
jgi:hypothetical protein